MSSTSSDFAGGRALITGAASGIGRACAEWLAVRGIAELVLVDRDEAGLNAFQPDCAVRRHIGDVADEALWTAIEADIGRLDHAVINAGIADSAPIADLDFASWRQVMSVNLDGALLSLRCAMRVMQAQQAGSVVLTASISGVKAEPGTAAYGASKAAVMQLARVAAKEGAPHGVRVNAIAPGGVDTAIWDGMPFFEQLRAESGSREAAIATMGKAGTLLGRYASAEELAGQIGFLLSDAAATITGSVLVSDGGYSL